MSIRQSATLLLALPRGRSYELLMMQRNMRSSFMPGAYVYPGGGGSAVRIACCWLRDGCAVDGGAGALDDADIAAARVYGDGGDALAHRLCAIRETFEETGVLAMDTPTPSSMALVDWRHRVQRQPSEFIALLSRCDLPAAGSRVSDVAASASASASASGWLVCAQLASGCCRALAALPPSVDAVRHAYL
jgi:8-oxo-dGTP pyrophosphatase MutT (NUDIX family)